MERPIIFKDDMIRAILEGRKTQTRRVMKVQPPSDKHQLLTIMSSTDRRVEGKSHWAVLNAEKTSVLDSDKRYFSHPYGQVGDRLWVREAHAFVPQTAYRGSTGIYQQINPSDDYEACVYRENFDRSRSFPWRPSIHMPRWASRITLEITGVRVERLQDISEADSKAEGAKSADPVTGKECVLDPAMGSYRLHFQSIWESINGTDSWDANPWVWVIEFRRVD